MALVFLTVVTTSAALLLAPPATPRCASPVLSADKATCELGKPDANLGPMAVVRAQLAALQRGEVLPCFDYTSSRFRQVAGPRKRFERIVRESPLYKPLIESEHFEVVSALQVGLRRWKCRVRVDNKVGSIPFSVHYDMELTQQWQCEIKYDLGQCIQHEQFGYRGVIVGWDHECKRSEEWCQKMNVDALPGGRHQPFYQVLADRRDVEEVDASKLRYVAQEHIKPVGLLTIEHEYFNQESFVAADEERGVWTPSPTLREQYPLEWDGCWLVDHVFPDKSRTEFDV